MSASQQAAELRAQADALEAVAELEENLLAAKAAYTADPNRETRAAKQDAALLLRAGRAFEREGRGDAVGGDAFVTNGSEG